MGKNGKGRGWGRMERVGDGQRQVMCKDCCECDTLEEISNNFTILGRKSTRVWSTSLGTKVFTTVPVHDNDVYHPYQHLSYKQQCSFRLGIWTPVMVGL